MINTSPIGPSRFVDTENYRIHYTEYGEGPPVLLLHGGGPGASAYSNYSRNIAAFAERHRTILMDFPGWGQSSKNLGRGNPFELGGKAIIAFLEALGIAKAHLVGNSFGGSATLYAAMMQPERVDRIVLMGPGGALIPGSKGPTEGILQLLNYYAGEGPTREKLRAFINNLVFDPSQLTPEMFEERFKASCDPDIAANPPLKMPPGPPPPESFLCNDPRLASLPHRVQMIWGLQDKVNPWEGALTFKAIPDQEIVLFSKCGHWAQWEQADKFNSTVLSFLARP